MKASQVWIPLERIEAFMDWEPAIFIVLLSLAAWVTSYTVLPKTSPDRRKSLYSLLKNLAYHFVFGGILYLLYSLLDTVPHQKNVVERILSYLGLGAIGEGAIVLIKASRILVLEYLYFRYKKVAFPVLLMNLATLLLSITLITWIGTEIFNVRLTPILATSAIFSIVLGLAMQDTLGNLFSGVALQFDKPYEIGDWIEINHLTQKWVGQVYEISWRATLLIGFAEEFITVPNRVMGQAEISNFSTKYHPIIRSQVYRLPFSSSVDRIKEILLKSMEGISEIRKSPTPLVLVSETTESWIAFKTTYYIDNYGDQYRIADRILTHTIKQLQKEGIDVAGHPIRIKEAPKPVEPSPELAPLSLATSPSNSSDRESHLTI